MRQATMAGVLLAVCAVAAAAQDAISLYDVVPSVDNHVPLGSTVEFRLRVQIDTAHVGGLWVYSNGFQIYSPDGATWDTTYGEYLPAWLPFGERWIYPFGTDGDGADTVVFAGEDSAGGFWVVYDGVAWSITIEVPDDPALYGKTVCLDSVFDSMEYFPWSTWVWQTLTESYTPTWDGPHCFTIGCCNSDGIRGDVDYSGTINVADLLDLLDCIWFPCYFPCEEEADVDGSGGINIADITFLVAYLFYDGPAPPPCP